MKVTSVRPVLVDRYLLVEVETDEGLTGVGESGTWAFQRATAEVVRYFGEYLVGEKNNVLTWPELRSVT